MSLIEIRSLRVLGNVGVSDEERAVAQPLEIDIDLDVDLDRAAASDDVADTVDYGVVSVAVAEAVCAQPHSLLERVASVAADAALEVDRSVRAVEISVRKLRPPIPLDVGTTGVRLRRTRT